jgi:hypothetical protein
LTLKWAISTLDLTISTKDVGLTISTKDGIPTIGATFIERSNPAQMSLEFDFRAGLDKAKTDVSQSMANPRSQGSFLQQRLNGRLRQH